MIAATIQPKANETVQTIEKKRIENNNGKQTIFLRTSVDAHRRIWCSAWIWEQLLFFSFFSLFLSFICICYCLEYEIKSTANTPAPISHGYTVDNNIIVIDSDEDEHGETIGGEILFSIQTTPSDSQTFNANFYQHSMEDANDGQNSKLN